MFFVINSIVSVDALRLTLNELFELRTRYDILIIASEVPGKFWFKLLWNFHMRQSDFFFSEPLRVYKDFAPLFRFSPFISWVTTRAYRVSGSNRQSFHGSIINPSRSTSTIHMDYHFCAPACNQWHDRVQTNVGCLVHKMKPTLDISTSSYF